MKALILSCLLVACSPPTPAQEVKLLQAEVAVTKTKCAIYLLDSKYPRDVRLDIDCAKLSSP